MESSCRCRKVRVSCDRVACGGDDMTKLLKKAFEEAAKLPDEDQDSPRPCWWNWRPSAAGTNFLRDQQTCSANSPRRPSRSIAPAGPSRWIRTGCDLAHHRAVSNCPWQPSTRYLLALVSARCFG